MSTVSSSSSSSASAAASAHPGAGATDRGPAIGVMLPRDLPAADVVRFARRAEELGFAELWFVEDLGFHGGIAQAATALAVTERIRVAIGLLPTSVRNVAFTAMEINTLAGMFPGRLEVGLGHGLPGWMRQVGVWPASPMTLMREQLAALRGLLAGETVSMEGRYVRLRDVRLEGPAEVRPPLVVGARGPRTLALSGELADGTVLAEPVTPEYVAAALADVAPRPGHRVVAYNVTGVDDDAAVARALVRPGLEWIGEPDWSVHIDPLPFAREFAELRASCADRAEFTRRLPDEWVDRLALAGPPTAVRERIAELGAAGVTSVVLMAAGQPPHEALESFGRVLQD